MTPTPIPTPVPVGAVALQVSGELPALLAALAILLVGWLVALAAQYLVRWLLQSIRLNERIDRLTEMEGLPTAEGGVPAKAPGRRIDAQRWISRGVFWLVMLAVLTVFFERLNFTAISAPLQALLQEILLFIPPLIGAAVLLVVAWGVATVVRYVVLRVAHHYRLDERLAERATMEGEQPVTVASSLATGAFWLVFLIFLPAIMGTLQLKALEQPLQELLSTLLAAIPSLAAAGLTLFFGWIVARIARQVITNVLLAFGTDSLGQRVGFEPTVSLSRLIGTLSYALILITVTIAAIDQLGIPAIAEPATNMLNTIMAAIPSMVAAALLLAVAYFVGKLVAMVVTSLLVGIGFDRLPQRLGLRHTPMARELTPSEIAGYVVLVAIVLFAAAEAANLLNLTSLAAALNLVIAFGAQLILALAILVIGIFLANLARSAILSAGGRESAMVATIARWAIIVFVAAMALTEINVGTVIVEDAFRALVFAIAAASALAFGLGSRETAGREVERWLAEQREDDVSRDSDFQG